MSTRQARPGKRIPWRRDPVILARLPTVERLRLQRIPNTAIAARLGVSEATIRDDCKRLDELWQERIQDEQVTLRAQIVAELDDERLRALEAAEWDLQCERAVLYGGVVEIDGKQQVVYRDNKGSAQFRGNKHGAIGQARQATMDKAKVLGLVVDKAALTDPDGKALDFVTIARQLQGRD